MSLKILGGLYKGLGIVVPKSFKDRPTSVILRRKLFDANQHLDSMIFVDLCTGTGMMGLEATSRGAEEIYFNDVNKRYLDSVKASVKSKKMEGNFHFSYDEAARFLKKLKARFECFDQWIFFLDPPYEKKEVYKDSFEILKTMEGSFEVWLEGCRQKNFSPDELEHEFGSYDKIFEQGTNYIAVYRF